MGLYEAPEETGHQHAIFEIKQGKMDKLGVTERHHGYIVVVGNILFEWP